jgi:hypothetical protein
MIMRAFLSHLMGDMEPCTASSSLASLAAELEQASREHGSVAVTNEDGWSLSLRVCGRLVLENVENPSEGPRHMSNVGTSEVVELWKLLIDGEIDRVLKRRWLPGYG